MPIFRELLPSSLIEQVKKNESDYEVVKEILTEYELIVDSYEQVRERPQDNQEQKEYNQAFAGKIIFVEHLIRGVKIFKVIQERSRVNPKKYEQVMLTICGLVRLRIGALILPGESHLISGVK